MNDFFIAAKTKKGGSIRYRDVVMLADETLTTIIAQTGDLVQHTGGFCTEDKIVDVVTRPTYVLATFFVNSAHVTNDKPDGVCYNLKIPVLLTCKTKNVKGHLMGDKHYEAVFPNGDVHWVHEYSLLLPEPFETERMKRDHPEMVK